LEFIVERVPWWGVTGHFDVLSINKTLTKQTQYCFNCYVDSFNKQYIPTELEKESQCQERKSEPIAVGDIILIWNEETTCCFWKLAQVKELIPSKDKVV